jgi:hypothetical protein
VKRSISRQVMHDPYIVRFTDNDVERLVSGQIILLKILVQAIRELLGELNSAGNEVHMAF